MKKLMLLQTLIIGLVISCTFAGNNLDKEVVKAYDLRIDGKVDDAKAMLDSILTIDSTIAMAHYEMARLQGYMMTGGGDAGINDVLTSAEKACRYAPKNATYAYFKAISTFLNAYISMQSGGGDVKANVETACEQFENVLTLKPDYAEAMLYLVEIYGMLPQDMGGNPEKAADYAEKLTNIDAFYGAKAKAALSPEDMDYVQYWKDLIVLNGESADYLQELGITYLFMEDPENAEKAFRKAIELDSERTLLILNLGRYHMYKVMQNQELAETELPLAIKYTEEYVDTDPIVPLKAYSLGMIAKFKRFSGDGEAATQIMDKAKSLDPYFSRASAIPSLGLFDPPDQVNHHYSSFFSPF